MTYTVTYSGVTDKSVGCHAKTRPSIPAPLSKIVVSNIRGCDGSYYDFEGAYNDIAITVVFSFNVETPDQWNARYRAIKQWLLSGNNGDLKFSDDAGFHYRVRSVQITNTQRVSRRIGEVTAVFTCEGYQYLDSGDDKINFAANITNEYDLCHPIYYITGNGTCTLTVNGKKFVATVGGNLTIDTERMLSYQNDSTWLNTTVTGDYEDLYLKPGANALSITNGFTCKITPQWRVK